MNNGLAGVFGGWAVACEFDWGWSFLGPGWFGWGCPPHAEGYGTSVFKTKKAAIESLRKNNPNLIGKFKVMRVMINVTENRHWKFK